MGQNPERLTFENIECLKFHVKEKRKLNAFRKNLIWPDKNRIVILREEVNASQL